MLGEESHNQEVRVAEVAVDLVTYRTKTCLKARLFRLKLLISKACFLNLTKLENKRQTISASQNMKRTTSLIPCPRTRRKKKTEVRTFKEWRNKEKLIRRLLEEKARRIRAFTVAEEVRGVDDLERAGTFQEEAGAKAEIAHLDIAELHPGQHLLDVAKLAVCVDGGGHLAAGVGGIGG